MPLKIVPIKIPPIPAGPPVIAQGTAILPGIMGLSASSPDNAGVNGQSPSGTGVLGVADSGTGVDGESTSGIGVWAKSESGVAMKAESDQQDAIQGWCNSAQGAGVSARNTSNSATGNGVWTDGGAGTGIHAIGKGYAGLFDGNVQVNGNFDCEGQHYVSGTLTVGVDLILKNADCAEDFDVASAPEIEPGTVMVLTDNGALEPSQNAYDKKVVGIISGAGDYRPGMILDRQGSSRSRMPIALVGKVYCKADALYGAIEAGDLLTTSPTRGHAMRAADSSKAFGAVIGKALRPLVSGRGLVPVLIALQ